MMRTRKSRLRHSFKIFKKRNIVQNCILIMIVFSLFLCGYSIYITHQYGFVHLLPFSMGPTLYVDSNGDILRGLHTIGSSTYYFSNDTGFMQKGFHTLHGQTYYFDAGGKSLKGLQTIQDHTYYFDSKGRIIKNRFVSDIKDHQPKISYFDAKGHQITGQKNIHGKVYTFDKEGNLQLDIDTLKQGVQDVLAQHEGNIGVYFKDLRTRQSFAINDQNMYPCCMIKTVALASVYRQIEAGLLNESVYQNDIEQMITISSNTSYNNLMIASGQGDGLHGLYLANVLCQELGMSHTQLHHGLKPGEHFFTDGGANTSCPSDIGLFFEKLYDHRIVSEQADEKMLQLLAQCQDNTALETGLPESTTFAHKTGCADAYYHDGGIVYMDGRDYILVVFSNQTMNYAHTMYDISSYIYQFQDDLCPL